MKGPLFVTYAVILFSHHEGKNQYWSLKWHLIVRYINADYDF